MDSIDVWLMWRELNNIQGLSEELDLFQDKNRNNIGKLKETNEKFTPSNDQDDKKVFKVKRVALDFNSHHDKILKV